MVAGSGYCIVLTLVDGTSTEARISVVTFSKNTLNKPLEITNN